MHDDYDEMDDDKPDKDSKVEPSAKDALEGKLGDIDKLVMLLLAQKMMGSMTQPPSPMMGPPMGAQPSPSPLMGGPPPSPMGASMPPPPMMGAGGPPPMGGGPMPQMQQALMAARGLV